MSSAGRFAVASLVSLFGASGCSSPFDAPASGAQGTTVITSNAPMCVTAYPAGTTLHLLLGEVYDLTSDYLYEDSFLRYGGGGACSNQDDLTTGSTLAVSLQTKLSDAQVSTSEFACTPYAEFDPAALQGNTELPQVTVTDVPGITIAAAFEETTVANATAYWVTVVATPSQNPNGTPTAAQLPPLVVNRSLVATDYALLCSHTWVATLAPAP